MKTTVSDLERTVTSVLTTTVKRAEIKFSQLLIDIDIENLVSVFLLIFAKYRMVL